MHWNNRGDEAANRALIEKLKADYPELEIYVQLLAMEHKGIEDLELQKIVFLKSLFPRRRNLIEYFLMYISKGKIYYSKAGKEFIQIMKEAEVIVHCPGGPAIGDIYKKVERPYLERLLLALRMNKKIMFYAPSMGPFNNKKNRILQKLILKKANSIVFREEISGKYLQKLDSKINYSVSVDTAFLNKSSIEENEKLLMEDIVLKEFLDTHDKIIGITITDLQWNPLYQNNEEIRKKINDTFHEFIKILTSKGYAIMFIPQLFGEENDYNYMKQFVINNCIVLNDIYNCNFQQYIISKLYAVVGMRYHSNIFSCKMGTPFISISYEQKMKGFMNIADLSEWCIELNELEVNVLIRKIEKIEEQYSEYKERLSQISKLMTRRADITYKKLKDVIESD